jgi:hypothetical protein
MPFHLPPIIEYCDPDLDVYMYIFSNLLISLMLLIAFPSLAYLIYLGGVGLHRACKGPYVLI